MLGAPSAGGGFLDQCAGVAASSFALVRTTLQSKEAFKILDL